MAITINGTAINLDWTTILIWCLVGLVAGFLASRVALGHGLGLFGDIVVGILGALLGGFLATIFHIKVEVFGYPIISQMIVAFAGAVILMLVVRLVSGAGGNAGRPERSPSRFLTEPRRAHGLAPRRCGPVARLLLLLWPIDDRDLVRRKGCRRKTAPSA